jgi:hypothetical protein
MAYELPWHTYELAKTVGCVFVLAALLERDVRWPVRGLWLLAAVVQIGDAFWWHETQNVLVFRRGNVGAGVGLQHALPQTIAGAAEVFREVYLTQAIALPILLTAGVLSLFILGRHRAFLTALWLVQLALVVLLAASGADLLRARRFLPVEGMSLIVILAALRTAAPAWRGLVVGLLVIGNVWALRDLAVFVRQSVPVGFSLPAIASQEGVGLVDTAAVRWAEELEARAAAGKRIVLLHSQACPNENFTNPVGTLERLYVTLGHARFVRSIVAFVPPEPCRYVCLPLPLETEFPKIVETLLPGQRVALDESCRQQMAGPLAALEARFKLTRAGPPGRFSEFVLNAR